MKTSIGEAELIRRLGRIRILSCDVDGVLTDGGLYYDANGQSLLRFNVQDGMGLKLLMNAGITVCLISQSRNQIIPQRAAALGIDYCFAGVEDKLAVIIELASKLGVEMSEVCHIADDVNDLSLLSQVGVPATVANGVQRVKDICVTTTSLAGGHGAVRELCDKILVSRGCR